MAQMFPPDGPVEGTTSDAERRIYAALQKLDDQYLVFHSIHWSNITGNRRHEGEGDFVVVHPQKGIIVIEVKGGRIRCEQGIWYQGDHRLDKSPFVQAQNLRYALLHFLQSAATTHAFATQYKIFHAVWFADVIWSAPQQLQFPNEIVLDKRDLNRPHAALDRVYRVLTQSVGPIPVLDDVKLTALIAILAPTIDLFDDTRALFASDQRKLEKLTDEQRVVLDRMDGYPRWKVSGGAGTGKTILAYDLAVRRQTAGQRVLFICFNHEQANWLQGNWQPQAQAARPQFAIYHVRAICQMLADRAAAGGLAPLDFSTFDFSLPSHQQHMGNALNTVIDALQQSPTSAVQDDWRYDTIIVDEAQDIEAALQYPIQRLLRDPHGGEFVLFYDRAQRDFPGAWDWHMFGMAPREVVLKRNCRNTRKIYALMRKFNPNLPTLTRATMMPEGQEIRFIDPHREMPRQPFIDAEKQVLLNVLNGLVRDENIPLEDILIVRCRPYRSRWREVSSLDAYQFCVLADKRVDGKVKKASTRQAKGFESNVVILVELDGINEHPNRKEITYTAVSRARHLLIVLDNHHHFEGTFAQRLLSRKKSSQVE